MDFFLTGRLSDCFLEVFALVQCTNSDLQHPTQESPSLPGSSIDLRSRSGI
jgi:hypothetical protein